VLLAYFILALHVLLIAGMAILVLFFRGMVNYMLWIFLGGIVLIALSAFYFIRRMRAEGKSLREMLKNPMFNGRSVEVSLLGGMATVKLGQSSQPPAIGHDPAVDMPRLEDPDTSETGMFRILRSWLACLKKISSLSTNSTRPSGIVEWVIAPAEMGDPTRA
jgi:hypothetical protein